MSAPDLRAAIQTARAALDTLRPAVDAGAPWPLAERFDHAPEASWGPSEVLAHVEEMLPFWLGETERILAGAPGPVGFGRVGTDPVRIAIIERDRSLPIHELYARVHDGADRWERRLATLTAADLATTGLHPTRGEMSVEAVIERLVVSHLEEHVTQLAELAGVEAPTD